MLFPGVLSSLLLMLPVLSVNALRTRQRICSDGVNTAINQACCYLFPVVQDLVDNLFQNECGDTAHGALRLLFHDAIGISPTAGGGGADGSIATFNATELTFPANIGIDDVLDDISPFLYKYANVLSPGDFIQLAGAVSLVQCPGAPRIPFFMGRPLPVAPSPPNLVPEPFDSVASILQRFHEVGFEMPEEIVSVIGGAHSIAGADDIVPNMEGLPFDQTPSLFDTQIFVDVQLHGTMFTGEGGQQGEAETAVAGTVRLQSDYLLARDQSTSCAWQSFANSQVSLAQAFARGVLKLSLLGQNQRRLVDCSEVVPPAIALNNGAATLPPGLSMGDIDQSCTIAPFPSLATQLGPPATVSPIPQAHDNDHS